MAQENESGGKQRAVQDMLGTAAAVMAADVLLIAGFVFLLLGLSKLINGFLKIEGSGELAIGIVLLAAAIAILARSKLRLRVATQEQAMPPMPEAPSDSYR